MKKQIFLLWVLALFVCTVAGCKEDNPNKINERDTVIQITQNFYVFSTNFDKDNFSKDEQCGYLLFEDRGSPFDYHGFFVWTENLPKEYQEHLLPVTVTFCYTEEICGSYPIINIIKIQKQ